MPSMGLGILINSLNDQSQSTTSVGRNHSPVEGRASEITKKKAEDRQGGQEMDKGKTEKEDGITAYLRRRREPLSSGPADATTDADWIALRQEAVDGRAGESIRP